MKKLTYRLCLIALLGVFCFSAYNIYKIYDEYKQGTDTYADIAKDVNADNNNKDNGQKKKEEVPKTVDFKKLKEINADVIGWIYLEDSVIDYPVVQGKNNSFYLKHLITGKYNISGTPFLDYRISPDFTEKNGFIYAHHMRNGSMFAGLTEYKSMDYYKKHKNFYLLTPKNNYRLEVFSAYVTEDGSDTYMHGFSENVAFKKYIAKVQKQSVINTGVSVSVKDQILSLSTCDYDFDNARFVVHCKLIKL